MTWHVDRSMLARCCRSKLIFSRVRHAVMLCHGRSTRHSWIGCGSAFATSSTRLDPMLSSGCASRTGSDQLAAFGASGQVVVGVVLGVSTAMLIVRRDALDGRTRAGRSWG